MSDAFENGPPPAWLAELTDRRATGRAGDPDFDQMARDIVGFHEQGDGFMTADIASTLRLVWNARGAADVTAAQSQFDQSDFMPRSSVAEAIQKLDR